MAYSGEIDDKDILRVVAEGTTYDDENYGKYAYTNLGYNIYGVLLKLSLGKKWQDCYRKSFRTACVKANDRIRFESPRGEVFRCRVIPF
jgi:hypothetical protein